MAPKAPFCVVTVIVRVIVTSRDGKVDRTATHELWTQTGYFTGAFSTHVQRVSSYKMINKMVLAT